MNVTISEGDSFLICNEIGDVLPGKEAGLYGQDTRFLSRYEIFVNDQKPNALTGRPVGFHSAVHYLTNAHIDDFPDEALSIARKRFVGDGLHEDLDVTNHALESVSFTLRLEFDADFADIFDVKSGRAHAPAAAGHTADETTRSVVFTYRAD